MSIQSPRYKPTEAYCLAVLDRSEGVIDELYLSLKTVAPIEKHQEWYQEKIQNELGKMTRIYKYPCSQEPQIIDKITAFKQKIIETSELLFDQLSFSLYKKVEDYTFVLKRRRDAEIAASKIEIQKSFLTFNNQIIELEDETGSSKAIQTLQEAAILIETSSLLIKIRISLYERKNNEPHAPSKDLLIPWEIPSISEAPKYRPSIKYLLTKAAYRNARIHELGVCINQQIDIGRYEKWFKKKLYKESFHIDALDQYAKRCSTAIPDEIAICRTSLIRVNEQFQKKSSEFNNSICVISSSSTSSSSSSSFLLAPKVVFRPLPVTEFQG